MNRKISSLVLLLSLVATHETMIGSETRSLLVAADRAHTLAILPWKIDVRPTRYKDEVVRVVMGGTQRVFGEGLDEIELTHSYHRDFEVAATSQPINEEQVPGKGGADLWTWTKKPNVEDAVDLAGRLEVDVVLMCSFSVNAGPDKLACYAIDVHSGEMYVSRQSTEGFLDYDEGSEAVADTIRGALHHFMQARPA